MRNSNKGRKLGLCIVALAMFMCCLTFTFADEAAKAAQAIMNKYQEAVIRVELTVEQGMSMFAGRKTESKAEISGVVVDPSGLTVLSLFSTDPAEALNLFMNMDMFGMEGMSQFKWESQVKDVKMLMPDGKEVPAQIVLRDKDLDLAFVRPIEKFAKPITALDLSSAVKPEVLDEVVVLNRLGKVGSRVPSVSLSRIQAIVNKPRTFYVPSSTAMEGGYGVPVFSLDGKVVGILLLRLMKTTGFSMSSFFGGMSSMGMLPVVLPAEDIVEVAKQAPQVTETKAEEKPAEEKKAEEKEATEQE